MTDVEKTVPNDTAELLFLWRETGEKSLAPHLVAALEREKERAETAETGIAAYQKELDSQIKSREFYEEALIHANDRADKADAVCKAFGNMKTEASTNTQLVVIRHREFNVVKSAWVEWWAAQQVSQHPEHG